MTETLDVSKKSGLRGALSGGTDHPHYKWVALSNTTLGMLIATINSSIVLISLPAIFNGIQLNPLSPGNVTYLLWMIMGYRLVQAVFVVSLGRLAAVPMELRATTALGDVQVSLEQIPVVAPRTPLADLRELGPDEVALVVDARQVVGLITGYDVARTTGQDAARPT